MVESSSAENMMNRRFIHLCALCILISLVFGCSRTSTPPAKVTIPDKQLLLEIARLAIAKRLPDVAFENLEPRYFAYRWYIEDLYGYTNDSFSVDFRVKNSKKRVDDVDGPFFKIKTVEVEVGIDGQIGKGGVSKGTETFRSEDLRASSGFSAQGGPVWGTPFYPLKLKSPPPYPNRRDLVEISLRAIRRFLPRVKTDDLVLRSASYTDMNCPEQQAVYVGFDTTFWLGSSVHTNITQHEVIVEPEEIIVRISTNGQVTARDVRKARGSKRYNRDVLPPPLGPLPEATEPQMEFRKPIITINKPTPETLLNHFSQPDGTIDHVRLWQALGIKEDDKLFEEPPKAEVLSLTPRISALSLVDNEKDNCQFLFFKCLTNGNWKFVGGVAVKDAHYETPECEYIAISNREWVIIEHVSQYGTGVFARRQDWHPLNDVHKIDLKYMSFARFYTEGEHFTSGGSLQEYEVSEVEGDISKGLPRVTVLHTITTKSVDDENNEKIISQRKVHTRFVWSPKRRNFVLSGPLPDPAIIP